MKTGFIYRIENFSPPLDFWEQGGYGFYIHLDRDFVRGTKQKTVEYELQERLQEIGKDKIVKILFPSRLIKPPYHFLDNSLLVRSIHVPGDNCEIGINYNQLESLDKENSSDNSIKFSPHNVDNRIQAYALLSLFIKWVDYAEMLI